MADSFTGTGQLDYDQAAFNKALWFAFRENNVFDQVASIKPTSVTNPGATVTFFKQLDLAPTSATLNESTDVDAVALSDSTVVISLAEKGNAVIDTQLIRLLTMIPLDMAITNVLGYNAGNSIDLIARDALFASTNVQYSPDTALSSARPAGRSTITPTSKLCSDDFRLMRNKLRRNKVPKLNGTYVNFLHPDVLFDLRRETGGLGWLGIMGAGSDAGVQRIFTDQVGQYEGFSVIETTNCPIYTNAGSSPATTDAYGSLFIGERALAKGFSSADGYGADPITVMSPQVDKLRRFQAWGWKHFVGYGIFESNAVQKVESGSSVGVNAS